MTHFNPLLSTTIPLYNSIIFYILLIIILLAIVFIVLYVIYYVYMYIVYVVIYVDYLFIVTKSDGIRKARDTIWSKLKVFDGC